MSTVDEDFHMVYTCLTVFKVSIC